MKPPVIQYSWIMLLHALTNTKRGLLHLHRLPPSLHYLTWILYKISTRLVLERRGAWCVLKLDQWRTEHHTNPASTQSPAHSLHFCMHANKKDRSRKSGQIEKEKKSFNRARSTNIEQIQYLSYLSIPSHSSTTPARGDLNMRGMRACPLLFRHVVCGKHMDCLVAFLHSMRGQAALPGDEALFSWGVIGSSFEPGIWMYGCD